MGSSDAATRPSDRTTATDADAVLRICRLLIAISVQSVAAVDDQVTLPELRALVVLSSRGPCSLSALAESTGLHLSKASRMCDRLATRGLLSRSDDPADRRTLRLSVTATGRQIVKRVSEQRRARLQPLLDRMAPARRALLVDLLVELCATGDAEEENLWALGWVT